MVSAVWVYRRLVLFATSGSIGNPSEQRYRDHSHTQSQRLTRQARVAANRRRLQTFPPPFPNGWYKLCDCGDVAPGEVREIEALGELFVVFRGRHDGRIGVLDAFCPHLGANLSVGGKVEGDCIKCPFHEWQFNTDGKCTKIPYAKKIPSHVRARAWPVIERNDMICLWYHAEREPPTYFPPDIPDIESGNFLFRGRYDTDLAMHIQDFAENSTDYAHFPVLHGHMHLPWTHYTIPGVDIRHIASWHPMSVDEYDDLPDICYQIKKQKPPAKVAHLRRRSSRPVPANFQPGNLKPRARAQPQPQLPARAGGGRESGSGGGKAGDRDEKARTAACTLATTAAVDIELEATGDGGGGGDDASKSCAGGRSSKHRGVEKPFCRLVNHAMLKIMGKSLPSTSTVAIITFVGPGGICYFRFYLPIGDIIIIHTHLPLAPLRQRTQLHYYADPAIPAFLVNYVVGNWISQWKNDVFVWENKKFAQAPMLIKEDGPMMQLRRWYRQFNTPNSKTVKDLAGSDW